MGIAIEITDRQLRNNDEPFAKRNSRKHGQRDLLWLQP
jgi:hypothetical protein